MKKLNVFIFPTDDRSGQASIIYHYARLGHRVYVPMHGTFGLNWKRIATWPSLLCKSSEYSAKRNIELYGFERKEETLFGEDFFLQSFSRDLELYEDEITCQIVDETFSEKIDVFHTLRGGEAYLQHYFDVAKLKFPFAKWVSSTFNQHTSQPGGFKPKNCAKMIPAPYEEHHSDVNNVCVMATDFERRLLCVDYDDNQCPQTKFASFNHNFANRQPQDFVLFCQMNALLASKRHFEVPNFGGNIRTQGADVRFAGTNGITGNFDTLTPRQAYLLTSKLSASIHFKADDWGGGVFYYCLNSGTPIITTQRYIDASNARKYLVNEKNCIVVNTPDEACSAVMLLENEKTQKNLSSGMEEMKNNVFCEDYWMRWERFLESLV